MRFAILAGLLALAAGGCYAEYPEKIGALIQSFDVCETKSKEDKACIKPLKISLTLVNLAIDGVHKLKELMQKIKTGMDNINLAARLTKYIPKIGTAIKILQNLLKVAKVPFVAAYNQIKIIDNKLYKMKRPIEFAKNATSKVSTVLLVSQHTCDNAAKLVKVSKERVDFRDDDELKTNLEGKLETFGGALNPGFSKLNLALGHIASICDEIDVIAEKVKQWPDLSGIESALDSVYDSLKPMLDFFQKVGEALKKRICIPDITEGELWEEAREALDPSNWFGRRALLSSMSTEAKAIKIRMTREEANSYLTRFKRAGDICFSVQGILDGVDKVLGPIVDLANKLIADVMKHLPSFDLPGFPDFDEIFQFDLGFEFPSVDFDIDDELWDPLAYIRWSCPTQIIVSAVNDIDVVKYDCSRELSSFGKGIFKRTIDGVMEGHQEASVATVDGDTYYVSIEVPEDMKTKQDDKHLTVEEAKARVAAMTPRQKALLRAKVEMMRDQ